MFLIYVFGVSGLVPSQSINPGKRIAAMWPLLGGYWRSRRFSWVSPACEECARMRTGWGVHTQAELYPPLRSATKTSTVVDIGLQLFLTNLLICCINISAYGIRRAAKNKLNYFLPTDLGSEIQLGMYDWVTLRATFDTYLPLRR